MIFARVIYNNNECKWLFARSLSIITTYNQVYMPINSSIKVFVNHFSLKQFLQTLAILVLMTLVSTRFSQAASINLSNDESARLTRGEILLQIVQGEKPGAAARVTALFHTNSQAIWDIIGYCKYEFIYMRGLKFCEMLDGNQFRMTMRHRIRNSWYTPTLDFTFEAHREPGGDGQARLIDGDLKILEGHWKFSPVTNENRVIVVHEIRIQPKLPAPEWLVRRNLQRDLPDMMACIRGLAEASGDNGQIEGDLKRCPGEISGVSK